MNQILSNIWQRDGGGGGGREREMESEEGGGRDGE